MPGCSGEPVPRVLFYFCTRDCGCSAHPAFPAPSIFEGSCWHNSGVFTPRDRGGVCVIYARRHSAHCNRIAGLHPSPVFVASSWGGWRIVSAAIRCVGWGPVGTAHRHIAPTPASASLWPTLPTKGGGIGKSELGSTSRRKRGEVKTARVVARTAWLFEN